jgi:hypothetical protein
MDHRRNVSRESGIQFKEEQMSEENTKNVDSLSSGTENNHESDARAEILNQIESGEMAVEEGLVLLQQADIAEQGQDVISQLELGEIDVQEAIRRIEDKNSGSKGDMGAQSPDFQTAASSTRANQLGSWWLLLLASGLAGTALGGWLATLGGWWWLLAAPSLLIGLLVLILALITYRSPWIHLRINTGQSTWPREIYFGFPVPTRLAAWMLRKWGPGIDSLDNTAIDELLMALDGSISGEDPILVEVNEDDGSGEKIQITIG